METGRTPQQPNFDTLSHHYSGISEQISLFKNLPVATDGIFLRQLREEMTEGFRQLREEMMEGYRQLREEMLEGFRQLREEMIAGFRAINRRVDNLEESVNGLQKEVKVGFKNAFARQQNGGFHTNALVPMYDMETGQVISNFPTSLDELDSLPVGRVDTLLRQITGGNPRGREMEKRAQLVAEVGILHRGPQRSLSRRGSRPRQHAD
ncbi:hypothetical protein E4U54_003665 [Claviceps lovelessii]|nr:hypothetical protein E4U54_003665 [Claviceps lovelessii]